MFVIYIRRQVKIHHLTITRAHPSELARDRAAVINCSRVDRQQGSVVVGHQLLGSAVHIRVYQRSKQIYLKQEGKIFSAVNPSPSKLYLLQFRSTKMFSSCITYVELAPSCHKRL